MISVRQPITPEIQNSLIFKESLNKTIKYELSMYILYEMLHFV